jgi:hypothetical protein
MNLLNSYEKILFKFILTMKTYFNITFFFRLLFYKKIHQNSFLKST